MSHDVPIYIVDDDPDLSHALWLVLRTDGRCGHIFNTPAMLLAEIQNLPDGVVVSDVCMPEIDGLELLSRLRTIDRSDPVIFMTGHGDIPLAVRALKCGASDFIEKPFEAEVLFGVIDDACASSSRAIDPVFRNLSPRERQVLDDLIDGSTNKQIAQKLNLSPRTVEFHRANLMGKLQCRNLSQLVRLGLAARSAHGRYHAATRAVPI